MKIYFDDTLIDSDYYLSISNSHKIYEETFELGSTASNSFTICIGKEAVSSQPSKILILNDDTNLIVLNIDEISEDDYSYTYKCTDSMTRLNFNYDASEIFESGSTTLLKIAQDICDKAGIELGTDDFRGYDKTISFYDNTKTARDYISYIAELNGGYAYIYSDSLYFIKTNMESVKTIDIDTCSDFKIGSYHKITRVVYELGTLKYEFGDETGDTLYLRGENVYINTEDEVQEIYNEMKDFEYYTFETSYCPIDYNVLAGQVITFTDGINSYKTIACPNLTYNGGWIGGYKLDIKSSEVQETQNVGIQKHLQNIDIKVDRDENTITSVVSQVNTISDDVKTSLETIKAQYEYQLTTDTTYQADKVYYKQTYDEATQKYVYEKLDAGEDYNVGDTIPENTIYEYIKIKNSLEETVNSNYSDLLNKFASYPTITEATNISIEETTKQIQTNTYTQTQIQQIIDGTGVDGVKVSAVINTEGTFDSNGLTIERTGAKTKSNLDTDGLTIMDASSSTDKELFFSGYDNEKGQAIVRTDNVSITNHTIFNNTIRVEKYGTNKIGFFYIGE